MTIQVLPEFFAHPSVSHSGHDCPGAENGCTQHPWMTAEMSNLLYMDLQGTSWASLFSDELEAMAARWTTPQAIEAEKARAAADAAERLRFEQKTIADRNAIRVHASCNKRGPVQIEKTPMPCKKLYSCEGGGSCGGVARPTTMHVSSECWAHEYHDPSGKLITKHVCKWLHPGEAGWLPQWNTDRTYRPDAVAAGLASIRGVQQSQQYQSQPKQQSRNRFAVLEDNSAW